MLLLLSPRSSVQASLPGFIPRSLAVSVHFIFILLVFFLFILSLVSLPVFFLFFSFFLLVLRWAPLSSRVFGLESSCNLRSYKSCGHVFLVFSFVVEFVIYVSFRCPMCAHFVGFFFNKIWRLVSVGI